MKSELLQAANLMLAATVVQEPEKLHRTLVHRNELDASLADEAYLVELVRLAQTRGLRNGRQQLNDLVQQLVKIQRAYDVENYSIEPLLDPCALQVRYFRNASGRFFGDLEPYFTARDGEVLFDHTPYWQDWLRVLPGLDLVDVSSSNHMLLLSEEQSRAPIVEFCRRLYARHPPRRTAASNGVEQRRERENVASGASAASRDVREIQGE